MSNPGDMDLTNVLADDEPDAPEMPRAGDWIVCADDHRNWRVLRDIGLGESLKAADVVSPNGLHPKAGEPVGGCSICGGSLIVNGNRGLRFRVIRAAPSLIDRRLAERDDEEAGRDPYDDVDL